MRKKSRLDEETDSVEAKLENLPSVYESVFASEGQNTPTQQRKYSCSFMESPE